MKKNFSELALKMHEENGGKVSIQSKVKVKCKDDLSTAYTPGVAEPCLKIKENKDNPKQPKEKDVKVKTNVIKNKNQEEVDLDKIEQQLKEIEDKKSKLLDVTKPISIIPDNVNDLTKQEELKEIKEKQDNLLEEVNAIKEQIKEEGVKTCNICGHKILSSLEVCPYCKHKF